MSNNTSTIGKLQIWVLRVGLAWLAVAVLMTGAAGWSFGSGNVAKQFLFMLGFPLITIGAAIILPFIEHARDKGAYGMALMLIPAWLTCTVGEGFGHLMIVASQRDVSVQEATRQDVVYDNAQTSVREQETKLNLLTQREKQLREANPFVTTVTAEGLRADIVVLDKQIALETARGGCKARCAEWMTKKSAVEKQISAIDEFNKIPDQIEAAKRGADAARAELAKLKKGHSDARSQTKVTAKVLNVSLNPGETEQEQASLILELIFVAVFVIGPMTLIAIGVKDWDKVKQRRAAGLFREAFARLRAWSRGEAFNPEIHMQQRTVTNYISDLEAENRIRAAARDTLGKYAAAA